MVELFGTLLSDCVNGATVLPRQVKNLSSIKCLLPIPEFFKNRSFCLYS